MQDNFKSTKFLMSMICLFMVFTGFIVGKIDAKEFMPFVLGILATYSVANVAQKFSV